MNDNGNERLTISSDAPESAGGIWPVLFAAPATLETGAPERFAELLPLVRGLTIHLRDSDEFQAYANSSERKIVLTRGLAECLWCACYAYFVFRQEIERQTNKGGSSERFEISSTQGAHVDAALKALRAAVDAASKGKPVNWSGLPQPVSPSIVTAGSSLEAKAGEMTLCALCFVLHHELAHVRLRHTGTDPSRPSWTLEQEKDADSEAIHWILGEAPENAWAIAKRAWGIVITTTFMTATRLEAVGTGTRLPPVEEQTHPQPYDRLDKAVQHEVVQRSTLLRETMTSLACAALIPHIRIARVAIGDGPYEDYADLYSACLDALANALVR